MIIRKLNEHGLDEFSQFINSLRQGARQNTPIGLLTSEASSEPLSISLELDNNKTFTNRYELGVYLTEKFDVVNIQPLIGDNGFWSALALLWFDQLCPEKPDGSRKPSMVYNYVMSNNYNHRPRHAIFTTWLLVDRYKEDARFLLSKELSVRGELIEQIMARQYYMGCEGVIRTASKLYYDTDRKTFKRGAAGRSSPGCVARFINWLQQLEVNYDLFSMSDNDLFGLMPKEFDRFM